MQLFGKHEILEAMRQRRVSAIIRTHDQDSAARAMAAAVEGGFRMIEFTLTTPGAFELIAEFSRRDDLLVGAGTVLSTESAQLAVQAGASFVVSPVCDSAVIAAAAALEVVSVPGTFTPNEMYAAHKHGADIVKLFPAPQDVAEYVRSILGPLPELRIFPTAGVTAGNCVEVLKAGAFGAGFVRSLFDPADMKSGNYTAIQQRAADIHRKLASA